MKEPGVTCGGPAGRRLLARDYRMGWPVRRRHRPAPPETAPPADGTAADPGTAQAVMAHTATISSGAAA